MKSDDLVFLSFFSFLWVWAPDHHFKLMGNNIPQLIEKIELLSSTINYKNVINWGDGKKHASERENTEQLIFCRTESRRVALKRVVRCTLVITT